MLMTFSVLIAQCNFALTSLRVCHRTELINCWADLYISRLSFFVDKKKLIYWEFNRYKNQNKCVPWNEYSWKIIIHKLFPKDHHAELFHWNLSYVKSSLMMSQPEWIFLFQAFFNYMLELLAIRNYQLSSNFPCYLELSPFNYKIPFHSFHPNQPASNGAVYK